MSSFCYFTAILVLFSLGNSSDSKKRVRRPIHLLTTDEIQIYVDGFQELRKNGILDTFTSTHTFGDHAKSHHSSSFWSWHSYLVYEIETQIRNLGDKYSDFAMPYWDFTFEAGFEDDPFILSESALMGGNGQGINDNYCISSELWIDPNYYVNNLCLSSEDSSNCCLKRDKSSTLIFPTSTQIGDLIYNNPSFEDMSIEMSWYHAISHQFIASNYESSMYGSYASDDPIFYLLHSFMIYIHSLWSTCWKYDSAYQLDEITDTSDAFTAYCLFEECGSVGEYWEDVMDFTPLSTEEWSLSHNTEFRVRDWYDLSDWDVHYKLGTFWENSGTDQWCSRHLNYESFSDSSNILTNAAKTTQSATQTYTDNLWADSTYSGLVFSERIRAISSLSCKYNRINSKNSCWGQDMNELVYETCNDLIIKTGIDLDEKDLSLDDLIEIEGVQDNECLIQIRNDLYDSNYFPYLIENIATELCNAKYDYKCPEYDIDSTSSIRNNEKVISQNIASESIRYIKENGLFLLFAAFMMICVPGLYLCSTKKIEKGLISNDLSSYGSFDLY